jgi:chromosome segregation ATPase
MKYPILREKAQLSEDIKTKQELIQQRKGEITNLQTDVETAAKQRESLEREKAEAQTKLDQLDSEVSLHVSLSVHASSNLHIIEVATLSKFLRFFKSNVWFAPPSTNTESDP